MIAACVILGALWAIVAIAQHLHDRRREQRELAAFVRRVEAMPYAPWRDVMNGR